ncbi:MAG: hypothetical protein AAB885_02855 [Patescibacteria group bacterium]
MDWRKELPLLSSVQGQNRKFLIAATTTVIFSKTEDEEVLEIQLERDPRVITTHSERKFGYSIPRPKLAKKLAEMKTSKRMGPVNLADENEPFWMSAGGVLPILTSDTEKYVIGFARDIFPIGYNAASGVSDNWSEILHPSSIIFREFFEELLITDKNHSVAYAFSNPKLTDLNTEMFLEKQAALWHLSLTEKKPSFMSPYPLNKKYRLVISHPSENFLEVTEGVLPVVWDIGSIDLIMPVRLHIDEPLNELAIFDGEQHWKDSGLALNRPVAALPFEGIENERRYGKPAAIWSSGNNIFEIPLLHSIYTPFTKITKR